MATSGTTTFNLDLNNIAEEAFERCGEELRTGYDLRTARRSLNLLMLEWANRGVNLWTVDEGTIAMVQGTITYNLPDDTVDLLDHVIRTGTGANQSDINITRISATTYSTIPNKNMQSRPLQVWIDRQGAVPTINVWPVADRTGTYTFVYWRLRRIEDVGDAGITTQDIPFRFLPALIAGLAFHLSMKLPNALPRMPDLKAYYEEQWTLAADEDREKASLMLTPRIAS
jgi:hypothetical protein